VAGAGATFVNSFDRLSQMSSSIPPTIQRELTQPESAERAVAAMKLFIEKGDTETFKHAVAIYCTGACERKEEVQTVLGALCRLAADLEGPRPAEAALRAPSEIHSLIFAGILRAFYGDAAVDRSDGASAQRKADAQQHVKSGTWPNRPTDSSYLSNGSPERFESIRQSVETRLRKVCRDLPDDEFQTLVDKVAREQVRGESRPNFR
jgi:hypothetical protein